jgi:hypothetical protein
MAYCSIDEAFPVMGEEAGAVARQEERRRAKTCKGPALSFLKAGGDLGVDVDRQGFGRAPEAELLSGVKGRDTVSGKAGVKEGFGDAGTQDAPGALEDREVDVIGSAQYKRNSELPDTKNVPRTSELPKLSAQTPSYFGRSEDDAASVKSARTESSPADSFVATAGPQPRTPTGTEGFASFSHLAGDNPGYQLAPDFLGSFGAVGYDKSAGKALLGTPNLNDAWKPLTPGGGDTAFFDSVTWPGGRSNGRNARPPQQRRSGDDGEGMSREEKELLLKRIDLLFAKLERLESGRNENAQTEIAIFVFSGLLLMFGMDVMRRLVRGGGA